MNSEPEVAGSSHQGQEVHALLGVWSEFGASAEGSGAGGGQPSLNHEILISEPFPFIESTWFDFHFDT